MHMEVNGVFEFTVHTAFLSNFEVGSYHLYDPVTVSSYKVSSRGFPSLAVPQCMDGYSRNIATEGAW